MMAPLCLRRALISHGGATLLAKSSDLPMVAPLCLRRALISQWWRHSACEDLWSPMVAPLCLRRALISQWWRHSACEDLWPPMVAPLCLRRALTSHGGATLLAKSSDLPWWRHSACEELWSPNGGATLLAKSSDLPWWRHSATTTIHCKGQTHSRHLSTDHLTYTSEHLSSGTRGSAVGRGTVRFPMASLEFFIDIILPAALYGPGVDSASNRNEYQEYFLGG